MTDLPIWRILQILGTEIGKTASLTWGKALVEAGNEIAREKLIAAHVDENLWRGGVWVNDDGAWMTKRYVDERRANKEWVPSNLGQFLQIIDPPVAYTGSVHGESGAKP